MSALKRHAPKFVLGSLLFLLFLGFFGRRIFLVPKGGATSYFDKARVTAVYDGDTIKVRFENGTSQRIRLIGIDAPEVESEGEKAQFGALMAKRFTFFYLYNKDIRLTYDWEIEDKHGRLLAYVWTENEGLFNKFILKEGFASAFLRFPFREDYRAEFVEAEKEARELGKGIWREGSYPSIALSGWKSWVGKIVAVRFTCAELESREKFLFLHDSRGEFSGLIPKENLLLFPEIKNFKDKTLSITGFLEDFRGKPQIIIFLPLQVQRVH